MTRFTSTKRTARVFMTDIWSQAIKLFALIFILFASLNSFSQTLVSENFEGATFPPTGWAIFNAGTGNNWLRSTATSSPNQLSGSTAYMAYNYTSSSAANTWAFTPDLSLSTGTNYTLEFYYSGTGTTFPEKMKVTIGNGQTVAAQTTTLINFSSITISTMTKVTVPFTVASAGTYNIAFNCYSAADQFNLAVDQVNIRVSVVPNAVPTTFTTSAITGTGMTIGWTDASTNETAFRVYRSTDNINFTQVGSDVASTSSAGTGTPYTSAQTGLTPGIQYFYRIAAVADAETAYLTGNATTSNAATYFYVGAATGDIAANANWNTLANGLGTTRSAAATTDILIVDGPEQQQVQLLHLQWLQMLR
ncbi:MAG: choice-of-anchor J domain-containing protein [Ferruginibacter sp.]